MLPAHAETTSPIVISGGTSGDFISEPNALPSLPFTQDAPNELKIPNEALAVSMNRWTVCVTPTSVEGIYLVEVMFYQQFDANGIPGYIQTFAAPLKLELAVGESKTIPAAAIVGTCGGQFLSDLSIKLDSYSGGSGNVSIVAPSLGWLSKTVNFGPDGCMLDSPKCTKPSI